MGFMRDQIYDPKRVFGLDLMRCAAILMVFIGHCAWLLPENDSITSQLLSLISFLGVEVFFVLSGFLIGRILYRTYVSDRFSISSVITFLKRRWFRTLPNYYLVLLINFGIAALIGYEVVDGWRYFLFLQNFASPLLPFFPESWSLSVEEFAYVLIPLVLLVGTKASPTTRRVIFLTATLALIAIFTLLRVYYNSNHVETTLAEWNIGLKSVVIYRLDSIFIGILCSWIYMNSHSFWRRTRYIWAVLGMIGLAFFTVGVGFLGLFIESWPFFWNVMYLPTVSITMALFLPVLSEWKSEANWIHKPVTFISLISYSIYLLHYSIILQLLKRLGDTATMDSVKLFFVTSSYIILTLSASYLLYRYFEKPIMDLRDRKRV